MTRGRCGCRAQHLAPANLALTYDNSGRLADAVPHHELGIDLARRTGHRNNLAMTLNNYAANRLLGGHLQEGAALLVQGRMVRAQAEDASSLEGFGAMLQAMCDYQSGRYRAALAALGMSEERLASYAPGYRRVAQSHLGVCWSHLGQWARLQQLLASFGDAAGWLDSMRLRVALLRHQMDLALGHKPDVAALREAVSLAASDDLIDLRHALQIEWAAFAEPDAGLRELDHLIDTAAALGFDGSAIAAHARAASISARAGQAERARHHAGAALELARHSGMLRQYPADLWLQCGQALAAIGDADAASNVFARGAQWVQAVARDTVPGEFVDSFLRRNPVNAQLLLRAGPAAAPDTAVATAGPAVP